mmetsp:Transcript_36158/g.90283  ORF Transcript_36158/g.90283 Transcript_36158/m.90283 type:complete len:117 (+) Transcript_36158:167-517(+)
MPCTFMRKAPRFARFLLVIQCGYQQSSEHVYFVLSGALQLLREPCTPEDLIATVAAASEPAWIGELGVSMRKPRAATSVVSANCTLGVLKTEDLTQVCIFVLLVVGVLLLLHLHFL